jgi:patatin-like phospholipase/acyl hydrolase
MLDKIMNGMQIDMKLAEVPPLCDYFDFISGTSTGG